MPVKLIGTIILLILVTIFAGANLDNKCDITFVFYTFTQVPVFMTVIISFVIGVILMIPFTFGRKKKPVHSPAQAKPAPQPKEESKTLFDFKIKRDATAGDRKEKSQKEKKTLFGFGKKNEKNDGKPAKSENFSAQSNTDDAQSTGAPV